MDNDKFILPKFRGKSKILNRLSISEFNTIVTILKDHQERLEENVIHCNSEPDRYSLNCEIKLLKRIREKIGSASNHKAEEL